MIKRINTGGVTTRRKPIVSKIEPTCSKKKIGSRIVTGLPIKNNNDTKILPESFTKIPDAISVFGDDNLAILDAIRKTS